MRAIILLGLLSVGIAAVSGRTVKQLEYHEGQEWMLFPDGDGKLHLINLFQEEPESRFNVQNDVRFLLFTRRNPTSAQVINIRDVNSLRGSNFNFNHPTITICHGWNSNANSGVNINIRNAYHSVGEFNVIVIDWSAGANSLYTTSRGNVRQVGPFVGQFINFLQDAGVALNRLHMVGHSLGAHISGLGAAAARGTVSSVVGLDPALPLFSVGAANERINTGNAAYVEIIHTNGGLLGFMDPLGDGDFYPNGGRSQPGCGIDIAGSCAHSRAHEFFADSIRHHSRPFRSTRCQNFQQIVNNNCIASGNSADMAGITVNHGVNGFFHLRTGSSSPFALG